MKIIVDAFGGDNAPEEIVQGAVAAVNGKEGFDIVLVGKENSVREILGRCEFDASRVSVVNAEDIIDCNDTPTEAIKNKPDSSIVVSAKMLRKDEQAKAFVSAGSTGAVLAAAVLLTPRVKGILRPALAPTLPNLKGGETMLLDCGANPDVKPVNLVQFALMGSVYMSEVMGVKNPRVALLSNGTEDKKGNLITKEAFGLLKEIKGLNFVGNMEAREILSGDYDVVVSDGFSGNIALKSLEGAVNCIFTTLKAEIKASKKASVGALLMKGAFRKVKEKLDYNKKGGAVLLGMEKVIVKAHGSSKSEAFKNAIFQAYNAAAINVCGKIKDNIDKISGENV